MPRQHTLRLHSSIWTKLYCLLLLSILVGCGGSEVAGQQESEEQLAREVRPSATRNGVDADNSRYSPKPSSIAKFDPNQPKPQPKTEPEGQYQLVLNLQPGKIYEFNQHDLGKYSLKTGESLVFNDNISELTFRPVGSRGKLTSVQVVENRIKIYKQVSPDIKVPFRDFDTSKPDTLNDPTAKMYAAKIGEPYVLHLSPAAKIEEFEGVRQVAYKMYATGKTPNSREVNEMTVDTVQDLDHQLGFYPPKSVNIGDSWDGSWAKAEGKIKVTMTYTLNSVSGGVATITGEGTMPTPDGNQGVLKNAFKIDRNSGWLVSGEETITITQDIGEGKIMTTRMTKTLTGKERDAESAARTYRPQVIEEDGSMSILAVIPREVFYLKVTGNTTRRIYGTDNYTPDSNIGAVAVHTGLLKDEETDVVRVTVVPGIAQYERSERNGVSSRSYSYRPDRIPKTGYTIAAANLPKTPPKIPAIAQALLNQNKPQPQKPKEPVYDLKTIPVVQPSLSQQTENYDLPTFTPDSKNLTSIRKPLRTRAFNGELWHWDLNTGQSRQLGAVPAQYQNRPVNFYEPTAFLRTFNGKTWVTLNWPRGTTAIWDGEKKQIIKHATGHQHVHAISLSSDGNWLTSLGKQGNLLLWDLRPEKPQPKLLGTELSDYAFTRVQTLNEGKGVLYFKDYKLHFLPADGGEHRVVWKPGKDHSNPRMAISPDGKTLAVDELLVDLKTYQTVRTHPWRVALRGGNAFCWSPDGRYLAAHINNWESKQQEQGILVWDIPGNKQVCYLAQKKKYEPMRIEFSPDGTKLLAWSRTDRAFEVWNLPVAKAGASPPSLKPMPGETVKAPLVMPRLKLKTDSSQSWLHYMEGGRKIAGRSVIIDLLTGLQEKGRCPTRRWCFSRRISSRESSSNPITFTAGLHGKATDIS